jgi:hypothetical protein
MTKHVDIKNLYFHEMDSGHISIDYNYILSLFNEILERLEKLEKSGEME